ncbi:sensor histidine kinase [Fodinisporobacter ferrooxydans]|uniref:histidine kinase n=1 Tax=Fodinisporobacter ferrooxydans TaxID=2901836 RepID=A0ABY4CPW6_9BACL|nr:sensor histidine kinase [Alicyclobacillaceae bacterium MYW30-H2]
MSQMSQFFASNKIIISFLYPLVFFLMGFGILLKNRVHSQFHLAKSLQYMAFFGILHSFADWGDIFIPLQTAYLSPFGIHVLQSLQLILKSLSFSFLLYFGIDLLCRSQKRTRRISLVAPGFFLLWLVNFAILRYWLFAGQSFEHWLALSNFWAKLLITLPSGIVSGYGMYAQREQFRKFGERSMPLTLLLIALLINLYTFSDGLVFSNTPFYSGVWLTDRQFHKITDIPIDFLRGINGMLISFFILKTLKIVDWEYQQFFTQAEKQKVVTEERNRIARDLHDGMIQSIYAIGLHLEGISQMIAQHETFGIQRSITGVQEAIQKLNDLIREIRGYIKELKMPISQKRNFQEELIALIQEFNTSQSIPILLEQHDSDDDPPLTVVVQILYIVKEALSNVVRHSHATKCIVSLYEKDGEIRIEIADNGLGLIDALHSVDSNLESFKQGIRNMKFRANKIGGMLSIHSEPNHGTTIRLLIRKTWKEGPFEDAKKDHSYAR